MSASFFLKFSKRKTTRILLEGFSGGGRRSYGFSLARLVFTALLFKDFVRKNTMFFGALRTCQSFNELPLCECHSRLLFG